MSSSLIHSRSRRLLPRTGTITPVKGTPAAPGGETSQSLASCAIMQDAMRTRTSADQLERDALEALAAAAATLGLETSRPRTTNREPDLVLTVPGRGVIVLEVKAASIPTADQVRALCGAGGEIAALAHLAKAAQIVQAEDDLEEWEAAERFLARWQAVETDLRNAAAA